MASKNPIGKIVETAVGAVTDPVGTAGKVVDQARGTVALGRLVAEQVGRSAAAKVAEVAGLGGGPKPGADRPANLRAVPEVNEPAHTVEPGAAPIAVRQDGPVKQQGDEVARDLNATGREPDPATPTMHRTAGGAGKRTTAKRAPAKKAAVRKAPAKKATAPKTAKKAAAPEVTPAAGGEDVPTPADVAKAAQKGAKRSPAKAPTKKSAAKKATKKSPPKTARQVADLEGEDVATPAGTRGAGRGFNPDTDDTGLDQPGTEPLMDPATAKAVKSESETLRKAAEVDKG